MEFVRRHELAMLSEWVNFHGFSCSLPMDTTVFIHQFVLSKMNCHRNISARTETRIIQLKYFRHIRSKTTTTPIQPKHPIVMCTHTPLKLPLYYCNLIVIIYCFYIMWTSCDQSTTFRIHKNSTKQLKALSLRVLNAHVLMVLLRRGENEKMFRSQESIATLFHFCSVLFFLIWTCEQQTNLRLPWKRMKFASNEMHLNQMGKKRVKKRRNISLREHTCRVCSVAEKFVEKFAACRFFSD